METSTLGNSGRAVSPLGLGLAALGRPGYINLGHADDLERTYDVESMRAHAHEVLDAAWDAGVRYFDAARSYGQSEEFLRSWIAQRNLSADSLTVGSKWGYTYTADWQVSLPDGEKHEVKDHTLPVLDRQFKESQALLGGQLDIYQIHSVTIESGVLDDDKVLSRSAELRDAGMTIGFSVSGPGQAEAIRRGLEIERNGRPVFGAVQATWNILEQSAGAALAEASAAGFGVIVKEALANGRLTRRNRDAEFQRRHAELVRFAADHSVGIDAIAMGGVLRQGWADVVLSGAATVDHLNSNLRAMEFVNNPELDRFVESPEESRTYWATRAALAWN